MDIEEDYDWSFDPHPSLVSTGEGSYSVIVVTTLCFTVRNRPRIKGEVFHYWSRQVLWNIESVSTNWSPTKSYENLHRLLVSV